MKCSRCKDPIPKGKEAYIKGKIVCQYCFNKLRAGRMNGNGGLVKAYKDWLTRKWTYKKN